jgi:hypothetical protein
MSTRVKDVVHTEHTAIRGGFLWLKIEIDFE